MLTGGFYMSNLMLTEDREIKKGSLKGENQKISDFKKKIADESYIDHAIKKIATDLSHYLTK